MADEVPSTTPAVEDGPMLCAGDNQKGPIGNNIAGGGLEDQPIRKKLFLGRAQRIHRRLPGINKIPLPAIYYYYYFLFTALFGPLSGSMKANLCTLGKARRKTHSSATLA
jgi:hypothetical protein